VGLNPYVVLGSAVVGLLVGLTGAGGGALMTPAPDKYIRPVITFVIFASGLKYAGLGTTALGWTLCLVVLACGGYWLARAKPWRAEPKPEAGTAEDDAGSPRELPADILRG
jgi:hypothetical protein